MAPSTRSTRQPSAVLEKYMTRLTDDTDDDDDGITSVLSKDTDASLDPALLKRNKNSKDEQQTRSTRRLQDGPPISRAQSTQRSRITDDDDRSSKLTMRSQSVSRSRSADGEPSSLLRGGTGMRKGTRSTISNTDESQKRRTRPASTQRSRSTDDVDPVQRIGSKSVQRDRMVDGKCNTAVPKRNERSKSVQLDRVFDGEHNTIVPKRKESIHQRHRNDAISDDRDKAVDQKRTTTRTAVPRNDKKESHTDKPRRQSTTLMKNNETDHRRRKSSNDIYDTTQQDRIVRKGGRRSEVYETRPRDTSRTRNDRHPNGNNDKPRSKRPSVQQDNNIRVEGPNRGCTDSVKQKSSSDVSQPDFLRRKSKSVIDIRSATSERNDQRDRRSLVRKPSLPTRSEADESCLNNSSSSTSSHSSGASTVIQFDPTHQSGHVTIESNEFTHPENPINTRPLVRKSSICVSDHSNNRPIENPSKRETQPTRRTSERETQQIRRTSGRETQPTRRTLVRKPSLESNKDARVARTSDNSDSSGHSSGASTVIQFDPTQQSGVIHVDPNDNDDCISLASFGDAASVVTYEMENSWAVPILSFLDSEGEELEEKPIFRRHHSSTKLMSVLQMQNKNPPSCGDSVHTKSSESHTTSSSFGRPQYYAPPIRTPANNTILPTTGTFADLFMDKDQSTAESNVNSTATKTINDKVTVKTKIKKKKVKGVVRKVDADDEKSQVVQKTKTVRSKLKKESSIDRDKSPIDAVPSMERQLKNTSNHSNHSLLPSDSNDDSDTDDHRMSNVFKPTPLNLVSNTMNNMTAYESETDSSSTHKKSTGSNGGGGFGKYFFGGGNNKGVRQKRSQKRNATASSAAEESDVISDSEHSCSSIQSSSSRRSGVFGAATRRLIKGKNQQHHALLGEGDNENDVVPFSW